MDDECFVVCGFVLVVVWTAADPILFFTLSD
jgi:hypothetical protein